MSNDALPRPPRTLLLGRQLAHPPRSGGALREMNIIRALAVIGPTYVFALAAGGPAPPDVPLVGWYSSQDAAAASMARGQDLLAAVRNEESPFHVAVSELAARELDAHLEAFTPDVVVVRGNELSAYVPQLRASGVAVVLDSDYAFADLIATMGAQDPNRARGMAWRHASKLVGRIEAETIGLVDQIWVAHTESRDSLLESYPDAPPIVVIPNAVDVASYPPSTRDHPEHIVYTGRFDFWPNDDAAGTLVREVLPRLDHATMSIVGMAPTRWMRELDDPRVTITGAVDDIRPYLAEAGVMAVPLHVGSGTRLKVLEAFAARVPVISTAKGVEGLQLVEGIHYVRAETAADFALAINDLRRDPARAERVAEAGHALVEAKFSLRTLERLTRDALSILTRAPDRPPTERVEPPMRILFFVPMYLPWMGGLEVVTSQILAELRDRGHEVTVLTSHSARGEAESETINGILVRRIDVNRAIQQRDAAALLHVQRDTRAFIDEFAPDVIHAHDAPASLWMYLRFLRGRPHPPIVLTLHNVMGQQYAENDRGLPGLITLMREADWLTGVSEDVVADALTLDPCVEGRITMIRNGVVEPALPTSPVPDGPPRFLAIGRLVRQKGFQRAIDAVAALAPKYPDLRLTIVGVGPLLADLQHQAAELGVTDRIEFAGRVDHDEINALLDQMVALVMPSLFEGLPLVALEAAWRARPVVGTMAPGLASAVVDGENGLLVDPEDPRALADAMETLVLDRDRARELGATARRRAEQEWSVAACADEYEAVYRRLGTR